MQLSDGRRLDIPIDGFLALAPLRGGQNVFSLASARELREAGFRREGSE